MPSSKSYQPGLAGALGHATNSRIRTAPATGLRIVQGLVVLPGVLVVLPGVVVPGVTVRVVSVVVVELEPLGLVVFSVVIQLPGAALVV